MSAGSIFKNIGNLFKTTEELEAEKRQRKRQMERGIEKSIDALSEGQKQAMKDQEKFYQQAKQKLAVGRETEARQFMQFSRMQGRNAENYMRQQLKWQDTLTKVRVATNMQAAAACIKQLVAESGLNPDLFDQGLESMEEVESFFAETNKAMAKKWEKDSLKAGETADSEGDASLDEMLARARDEVAAENGVSSDAAGAAAPGRS